MIDTLPAPTLASVAEGVARKAQRQGYVVPREIRADLAAAGLPEDQWKDVIAQLRSALHYRQGRYYHVAAVSPRLHQEQLHQQRVAKAVRDVVREHRDAVKGRERRGQTRYDYVQPVRVRTEDGKEFGLLSRDLSTTGIRLIGTKGLLGAKVRITLTPSGGKPLTLATRILWTCTVGDDLFENGGAFLQVVE